MSEAQKSDSLDPGSNGSMAEESKATDPFFICGADLPAAPDEHVYSESPTFRSTKAGVFERRKKQDGNEFWSKICGTSIKVEALKRDEHSENWGIIFSVCDLDDNWKPRSLPYSLMQAKPAEVAAQLASWGAQVMPGRLAHEALCRYLCQPVAARVKEVPRVGWHEVDGVAAFVLPHTTILPTGYKGERLVWTGAGHSAQHGFASKGTAEAWIEKVAKPLQGNSNIALCIGTALAGPVLKWSGEGPGLFHIYGASKSGKSLAACIGQSVYGPPKVPGEANPFGASWSGTQVGIERFSVMRSDIGVSLDEIGEGSPAVIRKAVYSLAGGTSKLRGTQDITLRPTETFRLLGISTGEPPMQSFLSSDGEIVPAGVKNRLVDVPAEVQTDSAFESFPREQIEEAGETFYRSIQQLHGAIGIEWIRYLVSQSGERIKSALESHRAGWNNTPEVAKAREGATSQVKSVISRFALVDGTLQIAIHAGILPWPLKTARDAIVACMTRWLEARPGDTNVSAEMAAAFDQVHRILASDFQSRFIHLKKDINGHLDYQTPGERFKRNTLGFVKERLILIERTSWREEFCKGFDPTKTAQHLRGRGLLIANCKLQRQTIVLRGDSQVTDRFYALDASILGDVISKDEAKGLGNQSASKDTAFDRIVSHGTSESPKARFVGFK